MQLPHVLVVEVIVQDVVAVPSRHLLRPSRYGGNQAPKALAGLAVVDARARQMVHGEFLAAAFGMHRKVIFANASDNFWKVYAVDGLEFV